MNLNATTLGPVVTAVPTGCWRPADGNVGAAKGATDDGKTHEESDFGAVVYIVVVLMFYSTGVLIMIVRYLKTEKKELEEEANVENFFKLMPDKKKEQEHRVNRVAIHAFHTLTSFSYDDEDDDDGDDNDFVSKSPSPQPLLVTDL